MGDEMVHQPDWAKVERLVGLPDYGVAFCVSPWPDGGWMAGVAVTDREWVSEQVERGVIDGVMLLVADNYEATWDVTDGFKGGGTVVHGDDAADAIDVLWAKLHGEADPPRRHQRVATSVART